MFHLLYFLPIILTTTFVWSISIEDCPAHIMRDSYLKAYDQSCYHFVTYKLRDYESAERECWIDHGLLVTIKAEHVQDFITAHLYYNLNYRHAIWIGLDDRQHEGSYVWSDHTAMYYSNFQNHGSHHEHQHDRDCVALHGMDYGGYWFADYCRDSGSHPHHKAYICEYPPVTRTVPPPTTTKPTTTTTQPTTETTTTTTYPTTEATTTTTQPTKETTTTTTYPITEPTTTTTHPTTKMTTRSTPKIESPLSSQEPGEKSTVSTLKGMSDTTEAASDRTTNRHTKETPGEINTIDHYQCPNNLPRDEFLQTFRNSCFVFHVTQILDYRSSEGECHRSGGMLVVANSELIQGFLIDKLLNTFDYRSRVWIGLTDSSLEGEYVWADGSNLNENGFAPWGDGEGPHDFSTATKDCFALDPNYDGRWHGYDCTSPEHLVRLEKAFICEYRNMDSSTPSHTGDYKTQTFISTGGISYSSQGDRQTTATASNSGTNVPFVPSQDSSTLWATQNLSPHTDYSRSTHTVFSTSLPPVGSTNDNPISSRPTILASTLIPLLSDSDLSRTTRGLAESFSTRSFSSQPLSSQTFTSVSVHGHSTKKYTSAKDSTHRLSTSLGASDPPSTTKISQVPSSETVQSSIVDGQETTHTPSSPTDRPISIQDCPLHLPRDNNLKTKDQTCYQFITYRLLDYNRAQKECVANSGELVVIKSKEIQNFVTDTLKTLGFHSSVWIGLNDQQVEGTYYWSDGSRLELVDFRNWNVGEGPMEASSLQKEHDCVALQTNMGGTWFTDWCENTIDHDTEKGFICEYRVNIAGIMTTPVQHLSGTSVSSSRTPSYSTGSFTVLPQSAATGWVSSNAYPTRQDHTSPEQSPQTRPFEIPESTHRASSSATAAMTTSLQNCPPNIIHKGYISVFGGTCFQFELFNKLSYNHAKLDCAAKGGILALLKTKELTDFILREMRERYHSNETLWIGLNDHIQEGVYVWENGEIWRKNLYANWAPGSGPESTSVQRYFKDCVGLVTSQGGLWYDFHCENEAQPENYGKGFICQYNGTF